MAIVKATSRRAKAALAAVDWRKIDAMTDEDIARQIAANPDTAPDLTDGRVKVLWRVKSVRLAPRHKIRLVRRAVRMSQSQFAKAYGLSLRSLQNWEQGTRQPDEATMALIKLIAYEPERVRRILNS
ncbi:MAG TPA: helix-turn-helix domain-containing protein [Alphaproteobacteria bacterium]|nr:helix-turn-helix domain-containing protein [Alphaproteobacteria bacterium]